MWKFKFSGLGSLLFYCFFSSASVIMCRYVQVVRELSCLSSRRGWRISWHRFCPSRISPPPAYMGNYASSSKSVTGIFMYIHPVKRPRSIYVECNTIQSNLKWKCQWHRSYFPVSYGKEAENRWVLSLVLILNVRRPMASLLMADCSKFLPQRRGTLVESLMVR